MSALKPLGETSDPYVIVTAIRAFRPVLASMQTIVKRVEKTFPAYVRHLGRETGSKTRTIELLVKTAKEPLGSLKFSFEYNMPRYDQAIELLDVFYDGEQGPEDISFIGDWEDAIRHLSNLMQALAKDIKTAAKEQQPGAYHAALAALPAVGAVMGEVYDRFCHQIIAPWSALGDEVAGVLAWNSDTSMQGPRNLMRTCVEYAGAAVAILDKVYGMTLKRTDPVAWPKAGSAQAIQSGSGRALTPTNVIPAAEQVTTAIPVDQARTLIIPPDRAETFLLDISEDDQSERQFPDPADTAQPATVPTFYIAHDLALAAALHAHSIDQPQAGDIILAAPLKDQDNELKRRVFAGLTFGEAVQVRAALVSLHIEVTAGNIKQPGITATRIKGRIDVVGRCIADCG
ncbi:hypothetical protein [Streptomyces sp. NPDC101150]|uniref:hypothetical protein n=1 Tax=Streptomyces sp. NPDC101150 TaxID=3366114 RepID=UPI0038235214